jgi:prophage regulatory protein
MYQSGNPAPTIPDTGYLRQYQVLGDKKRGIPPIYPVSKSTWWAGIKQGRFPKPVKLSARCVAWRVEDIRALVEQGA